MYPDQNVIVYTKLGNKYPFNFDEIHVGTHAMTQLVMLAEGDEIIKLDLVTDTTVHPST